MSFQVVVLRSPARPSSRSLSRALRHGLFAILFVALLCGTSLADPVHEGAHETAAELAADAQAESGSPGSLLPSDTPVARRAQSVLARLDDVAQQHVRDIESGALPIVEAADAGFSIEEGPAPTVMKHVRVGIEAEPEPDALPVAEGGTGQAATLGRGLAGVTLRSANTGDWTATPLPQGPVLLASPTLVRALGSPGFVVRVQGAPEALAQVAAVRLADPAADAWAGLEPGETLWFAASENGRAGLPVATGEALDLAFTTGVETVVMDHGEFLYRQPTQSVGLIGLAQLQFLLAPAAAGLPTGLTVDVSDAPASPAPSLSTPADGPAPAPPTSSAAAAPVNVAPLAPQSAPAGPTSGQTGIQYSFSTSAIDPDLGQVKYRFNWGDGTTTTTGFYASGATGSASHAWTSPGTYSVTAQAIDSDGAVSPASPAASIQLTTRSPLAPAAPTAPTGTLRTNVPAAFTFRATDPDGDNVRFVVAWGDGQSSTTGYAASGAALSASHAYATPNTYTVTATAQDVHGAMGPASAGTSVTPRSQVPAAPSAPAGPTPPLTGVVSTYRSTATDADGDVLRYTYAFYQGSTLMATRTDPTPRASGTQSSVDHTWTTPGPGRVTVYAVDPYGETSATVQTDLTIQSRPPTTPTTPTGTTSGLTGTTYTYSSSSSDPDGDTLQLRFDWGDGQSTTTTPAAGGTRTATHAWSVPGTYQVRVTAIDQWLTSSAQSSPLAVSVQSRAPSTPTFSIAPTAGQTGVAAPYRLVSTDPDGDAITYTIDWAGATSTTAAVASGIPVDTTHTWLVPGTYVVKAKATDPYGQASAWSAGATIVITSRNPSLPDAPTGPADPRTGRNETYTSRATDPDGDQVKLGFEWTQLANMTLDWSALVPSGQSVNQNHVWTIPGTHSLRVKARDQYGQESAYTNPLPTYVRSRTPSVPLLPAGPVSVLTGVPFGLGASSTDPDGDALVYQFRWGDGTTNTTAPLPSGVNGTASKAWSQPGTYSVVVVATDPYGETAQSAPVSFVAASRPPTADVPTGPSDVPILTSQSVTVRGTDPDGDQVRMTIDWGDGNTSVGPLAASGAPFTASHSWSRTGTFLVKARAQESHNLLSAWSAPLQVTVHNEGPAPVGVAVMDVVHYGIYGNSGQSYSFTVKARDPELHSLRYTVDWGDGNLQTTGTLASGQEATLAHTWTTSVARVFQVRYRADDVYGGLGAWSDPLDVLIYPPNTVPAAPAAALGPSKVLEGSGFLTFIGSDPDGDNVRLVVDWGDGQTSTTAFGPGGERVTLGHAWAPGTYAVRSRAEDPRGGLSAWSATWSVAVAPFPLLSDLYEDGTLGGSQWQSASASGLSETGGALKVHVDQNTLPARRSQTSVPFTRAINANDGVAVEFRMTGYVGTTYQGYAGIRIVDADNPVRWLEIYQEGPYVRGNSVNGVYSPLSVTGTTPHDYAVYLDGTGYMISVDGGPPSALRAWTGFQGTTRLTVETFADTKYALPRTNQWDAYFHSIEAAPWMGGVVPTGLVAATAPATVTQNAEARFLMKATHTGSSPIRFETDWGDGTTSFSDWFPYSMASTTQAYADHVYTQTGSKTMKYRAWDVSGHPSAAWSAGRTFTVQLPNMAPRISEPLTATTADPRTGLSTSFTITGADPNPGTTLTFVFDWGDGTTSTSTRASGYVLTVSHVFSYPGYFSPSVTVRDPGGLSVWAYGNGVSVRSRAPTVYAPVLVDTTPEEGYFQYKNRGNDADADPLYFETEFRSVRDGWSWTTFEGTVAPLAYLTSSTWIGHGPWQMRSRSMDQWGEYSAWTTWVSFTASRTPTSATPPSAPEIVGPSSGWIGSAFTYHFRSEDVNGDQLHYEVNWGDGSATYKTVNEGVLTPELQFRALNWNYQSSGWHVIQARAKDPSNLFSGWSSYWVYMEPRPGTASQAPGQPAVPAGQATVLPYTTYEYTVSEPDPQGDPVRYIVYWGDGQFDYSPYVNSGEPYTFSHAWNQVNTCSATSPCDWNNVDVWAQDWNGNQGPQSASLTVKVSVIPNDPPNAPYLYSGPSTLKVGDSGVFTVRATDPNGDRIGLYIDWGDGSLGEYMDDLPSGGSFQDPHAYQSPGTYYITSWARDIHRNYSPTVVVQTVRVEALSGSTAYQESFENGWNGWAHTGRWDTASAQAYSGWWSLYFGSETMHNYDSVPDPGLPHSGLATSPALTVPAASPHLAFWSWHHTRPDPNVDVRKVEVLNSAGTSVLLTCPVNDPGQRTWSHVSCDLSSVAGQSVKVRFSFNTVTGLGEDELGYEGWYVDLLTFSGGQQASQATLDMYTSDPVRQDRGQTSQFVSHDFSGGPYQTLLYNDDHDHVHHTLRLDLNREVKEPEAAYLQVHGRPLGCDTNPLAGTFSLVVNGHATPVDLCPLAGSVPGWMRLEFPGSSLVNGYNVFSLDRLATSGTLELSYATHSTFQSPRDQHSSDVVEDGVPRERELIWRVAADRQSEAYVITTTWQDTLVTTSNGQAWRHELEAVVFFAQDEANALRLYWFEDENGDVATGWSSQTWFQDATYASGADPAHEGWPHLVAKEDVAYGSSGYSTAPTVGQMYSWYAVEDETKEADGTFHGNRIVNMIRRQQQAPPLPAADVTTQEQSPPGSEDVYEVYLALGQCSFMGISSQSEGQHDHLPGLGWVGNPAGHNCLDLRLGFQHWEQILDMALGTDRALDVASALNDAYKVRNGVDFMQDAGKVLDILTYLVTFARSGDVVRFTYKETDKSWHIVSKVPFTKIHQMHPDVIGIGLAAIGPEGPLIWGVIQILDGDGTWGHSIIYTGTTQWRWRATFTPPPLIMI